MAKIKNISGEDRILPWLGGRLVLKGQVVEIPDEDAYAYLCQAPNWEPANAPTKKLFEDAVKALEPATDTPTEG